MPSGTISVVAGAINVVVVGAFGTSSYQAFAQPAWTTTVTISAKAPSQFTVSFGTPAPPGGETLDWQVLTGAVPVPPTPTCITAGTIMTRMRAKIPDSVFVNEVPQPEMDGKFRAQTIYAWMDDALQVLTQKTGWTLTDWWAMPQVRYQPYYDVDARWTNVEGAFSNQWPLDLHIIDEIDTIWPNTQGPMATQPLSCYVRNLGNFMKAGLWPTPPASDPQTTLIGALSDTGTEFITVADRTNFLSYGYIQIDQELIQYQQISGDPIGTLSVLTRGLGGTTPAVHADGATVQHLGFWIKGRRQPTAIQNSTSCIELPRGWLSHLETYVLANCRMEQKRFGEGDKLMQNFERACAGISADPQWRQQTWLLPAYGTPKLGPIYFPGGGGILVP
jgi:hypothetical protein